MKPVVGGSTIVKRVGKPQVVEIMAGRNHGLIVAINMIFVSQQNMVKHVLLR